MKRMKLFPLVFLVNVIAVSFVYASGFQLNEHGARAMAQAGAFAARAYDPSAIFFNPAGLAFQTQSAAYAGATLIIPATSFYGPYQHNSNEQTDLVKNAFTPINVYLSYPMADGLTAALGVNNPYGLGTEWNADWVGRFLTTKVDLKTFFISPTLSYRITEDFSVGAGVNFVTGSVLLERAINTGFGDPRVSIDMSATGWGFNVGALYKITTELSVGASYRSPVKVDATGKATFTPSYGVLPNGDATSSIKLPATAFLGIAYKPIEELELEADYQFVGWSSYNELVLEFKANNSRSVAPKNYKDSYILRFGGEYTLNDDWRIRAGYFFDKSPVRSEYMEPMLPDADRDGYNIGFGYSFSPHFSIDVAYLYLDFRERKVENTIPEISFNGTYKTLVHLLAVNFGYTL